MYRPRRGVREVHRYVLATYLISPEHHGSVIPLGRDEISPPPVGPEMERYGKGRASSLAFICQILLAISMNSASKPDRSSRSSAVCIFFLFTTRFRRFFSPNRTALP